MKAQFQGFHTANKFALVVSIVVILASVWTPGTLVQVSALMTQPAFTQLDLYPNIETMGVVVTGTDLPKNVDMLYRQSGEANWHTGHPLMRTDDGRLIGSLFGLAPLTTYEVKVQDGATEINGTSATQSNDLSFIPSAVIHVDGNAAPGGDGSTTAPFQTIQEGINHATPGTQVLVADGIYQEALTFPNSGSPNNWIQLKAEGSGAILDGSDTLSGNVWSPDGTRKNVYFTKIENSITYLARDQERYYQYDDHNGLNQSRGHNGVTMNEGWYYEPSTKKLYVRSLDDPANHTWHVPRLSDAFEVEAHDWIWIEGFEMRFYGATNGCGVCLKNASHVVIRKNKIHNVQLGVYINWNGSEQQGNDTRIEYNEIYDPPVNEWPWNAVKGSSMEGTAIVVRGHVGAIVRGNKLHNYFNGIYTGISGTQAENPGIAFDMDVYNNHIYNISDDALEPEGACINNRFRNNTIDTSFVGVSLAPITQGPTWVLRSTFANYFGRGIKWDGESDGIVLLYHNTFWSTQNVPAMDLISIIHNTVLRNNIFQGSGFAVYEVRNGSTGQDWNYDNWYTTHSSRFMWEGKEYASLAELCSGAGLDCNGHDGLPGLSNPASGDFTLLSTSPNIDRGTPIPGINDGFAGSAPDIGAYEYAFSVDLPPTVVSSVRADPDFTNAASVNFTLTFSEPIVGVDLAPPFNDFTLTTSPGIVGASITSVTPVSGTTYTVSVNTGSGSGTIRLDLLDDNSIVDMANNPLGGPNTGDGNFSTGETYTIEKTTPTVTGSLRAGPSPTQAANVNFNVTFSEAVSGVDATDFSLTTTGNLSGASIAYVNGSGNTYTVTVNTGSGDGGLRLDVLDDDSIVSASGTPLGGPGAGNGNFNAGEAYMIDKTAPTVTGSLRADPSPTSADSVNFTVVFTEAVSGVDRSDFFLSTSGNISGASITSINGSGYLYTVTVSTGSGDGTLRLDVLDDDSIVDVAGLPLAGAGIGNGNYTVGEEYTVKKISTTLITETFRSNGKNDGWVLESKEDSNRGGSKDSKSTTIVLGDNNQDRQYRAILDFPTDSLPDNAVITKALLMVKGAGSVGTNPFLTHQNILVDIHSGPFGYIGPFSYRGLQASDFQSPASQDNVGLIQNNPYYDWYWAWLDSSAFQYINVYGITQFRLRFQLDDNDDRSNDYIRFYSGDANDLADRPRLSIEYYVP